MTTTPRRRNASSCMSRLAVVMAVVLAGCATRTPAPVVDRQAVPPRAVPMPVAPAPIVQPAPAAAVPAAPEPDWRPPTYTVKRGDTLYQVALEHGLDYRELAAWNAIENVNLIRVGQVLKLTAPGAEGAPTAAGGAGAPPGSASGGTLTAPLRTVPPVGGAPPGGSFASTAPAPAGGGAATLYPAVSSRATDAAIRTSPRAIKEPWSEQAMKEVARTSGAGEPATVARAEPPPRPTPTAPSAAAASPAAAAVPAPAAPTPAAGASPGDDEGLDWVWPAKGRVVAQFSESASLKGIDIAGSAGDTVSASAPGKVVYAGTGLRGYGKLVIVKHNATYLTAYAHNREILVKEGQSVARGQKIAEMGSTDADQVKLHFEIRRLGRPMDPLRFLPPA